MTTTVRREKRFEAKLLQVRIPRGIEQRLQRMSLQTGVDRATLTRLALNSGLSTMAKSLPTQPAEEPQA